MSNRTSPNPAQLEDRWMSQQETAHLIGVAVSTLARWRREGGKGLRYSSTLGRDARYLLSDVTAWMKAGLVNDNVQTKAKREESAVSA